MEPINPIIKHFGHSGYHSSMFFSYLNNTGYHSSMFFSSLNNTGYLSSMVFKFLIQHWLPLKYVFQFFKQPWLPFKYGFSVLYTTLVTTQVCFFSSLYNTGYNRGGIKKANSDKV